MTQVSIGQMDTVIEFAPETITATPPGGSAGDPGGGIVGAGGPDVERLRALLRPIIIELLEDELGSYRRMRG
jgi:hypothetical protein